MELLRQGLLLTIRRVPALLQGLRPIQALDRITRREHVAAAATEDSGIWIIVVGLLRGRHLIRLQAGIPTERIQADEAIRLREAAVHITVVLQEALAEAWGRSVQAEAAAVLLAEVYPQAEVHVHPEAAEDPVHPEAAVAVVATKAG